jgi:hypothetical protein
LPEREIARELGWITQEDICAADVARPIVVNTKGIRQLQSPDEVRIASAERRLQRYEKALCALENRIMKAGLAVPAWLMSRAVVQ